MDGWNGWIDWLMLCAFVWCVGLCEPLSHRRPSIGLFTQNRCEEAALWLQDLLLSTFPSVCSSSASTDQGVTSAFDVVVAVGHGEFMHLLLKKVSQSDNQE